MDERGEFEDWREERTRARFGWATIGLVFWLLGTGLALAGLTFAWKELVHGLQASYLVLLLCLLPFGVGASIAAFASPETW